MITRIIKWWKSRKYYVIADHADNSITLSKALFDHMKNNAENGEAARVFVFKITKTGLYGFMMRPDIDQPTQMCDIQYNEKYQCIGFETLCPSVGRILYDYGLPEASRIKLSVSIKKTNGNIYYQMEKP